MLNELPTAGACSVDLAREAHRMWMEAARKAGVDLTGFNPEASLQERLAWAVGRSLDIATVLSRFSQKLQCSTADQVRDCVEFAGGHLIYPPPEFVCIDEALTGRKMRRDGLNRAKWILQQRLVQTLLVFKVSRMFRIGYKGYAFFQEEVVEEGLRAISVSQGIDTRDELIWKKLVYLHGLADEMLLETIADHVRSGLKGLFLSGYVTGALPVGYRAVEVPGGRPTKLGRPRTMPQVDPDVAKMIREHYGWIRDGMPIKEGWRRWVAAGGPCDRRSTLGYMTYAAYHRMLANPRYTGLWGFGRKRNRWSSKRDYNRQIEQPETEVVIYQCDELRIVEDDLSAAVRQILAENKLGPRGPKKQKDLQLWDMVTDCFFCPHCDVRFYQSGANGKGMQCKRGDLCPHKSTVQRQDAVRAVCEKLSMLLQENIQIVEELFSGAQRTAGQDNEALSVRLAHLQEQIAVHTNKINDLRELAGQGTDQDRAETKGLVRMEQARRADLQHECTRLQKALASNATPLTPERGREIVATVRQLLDDASNGQVAGDAVFKAAAIFRRLIGGRVWCHVERRPGRKRTVVRGVFQPSIMQAICHEAEIAAPLEYQPSPKVDVWLRPPPRLDLLAERVHQLLDIDGQSYREAAATLQKEGHNVNSGNLWYSHRRWYQMQGLPVPKRPYNNGRRRRSA